MDGNAFLAALAAVGLKIGNLLAGAITSFAALRFFGGLHIWEKWLTFIGGWALAAFGAPPVTELFELRPKLEVGIALLLGMFGMALTAAIMTLIKDTLWVELFRSVFDTFFKRR
jgi:predicted membrane channel-forming protein YqfA (hemolysin III family)